MVVVGAGLAGPNAAAILAEQGMRGIVLEAGEQPGRRIRTVTTADGPIDVGASQVGRSYAWVIDLCRSHGLALVPEDRDLLKLGTHQRGGWIAIDSWADNPFIKTVWSEYRRHPEGTSKAG